FVLDEPSIGLHPRDMHRIVQVMHRLRDNGNSLVVVEHDPQVMVVADRVIDMGPGPGERGGQIVFDGTPDALRSASTLTGRYLGGKLSVESPGPQPVAENTPRLVLEGVRANNLKNVSVSIPLGRLVCITSVSGSGKATLVQDVLSPAMLEKLGRPTEAPGEYDRLLGEDRLYDVTMVDQTPIGKTARSNPASYVGAFDAIRKLFAQSPLARERGYTGGTFSLTAAMAAALLAAAPASNTWKCSFFRTSTCAVPTATVNASVPRSEKSAWSTWAAPHQSTKSWT